MKRVIALVDMDCFYAQVEQRLNPEFRDKPTAAVYMGFKASQGGGLIAITYDAKARGVSRLMNVGEALKVCPELNLSYLPELNGKLDLTRFRDSSKDVMDVLCRFCDTVEKASVDEWYLDMTELVAKQMKEMEGIKPEQLPNTCVIGWQSKQDEESGVKDWLDELQCNSELFSCDHQLAVAAAIVEEMRAAIYKETTFRCSAGIAHNKTLAKMGSWLNKPNQQTVIPECSVAELFKEVELKKVRNLGGKVGTTLVEEFGLRTMSDLQKMSLIPLQERFGVKTGKWLFDLGQGIDNESVRSHVQQKSFSCSKNFFGNNALSTKYEVKCSVFELAEQIHERLAQESVEYKRHAQLLTLTIQFHKSKSPVSRSFAISTCDPKIFYEDATKMLQKMGVINADKETIDPPIALLGLTATKFKDEVTSCASGIEKFLTREKYLPQTVKNSGSALCKRMEGEFLLKCDDSRPPPTTQGVKKAETLCALFEDGVFAKVDKMSNNEPSTSKTGEDEDTIMCEECEKCVSVWDFPEHADFHVALKLQSELCNSSIDERCSTNKLRQAFVQQTTKNVQRCPKKTEMHPPRKKLRCIDSYFTPAEK